MLFGIFLFVIGLFIATQNTQSKIAWPLIIVGLVLIAIPVRAHDLDHPELDQWYAGLMQPDNPTISCCGKADAYWCDEIHVREGKTFCTITDDRVVPGRTPFPVGTVIEIPDRKLKWDRGNPVGHAVVFLSSGGAVYCFVQSGGA